jgi:hypothetical protein
MRLCVLEVRYDREQEQEPELAEAFTALDNADGATPFTRLMLWYAWFDATGLFSSHQCSALCEFELNQCDGFAKQAMQALAINARDSLESLTVLWMPVMLIVPLAGCRRLERLALYGCNSDDMQIISQICKAPLRFVMLTGRIDGDDVRAIVPALAGVVSRYQLLRRDRAAAHHPTTSMPPDAPCSFLKHCQATPRKGPETHHRHLIVTHDTTHAGDAERPGCHQEQVHNEQPLQETAAMGWC